MTELRLPLVYGSAVTGQGDDPATLFAAAWLALLGDRTRDMTPDDRLAVAAQGQATWLAGHDFVPGDPHRGGGGSTANERVRAAGYKLPAWWPRQGNNVESAIRSWQSPAHAAATLTDHDTHRDHMRRLGWFDRHRVWGVGAAAAVIDRGGWFYVVVTAVPEEVI